MKDAERKINKKDLKEVLSPGKKIEEMLDSLDATLDYEDLIYLMRRRNN